MSGAQMRTWRARSATIAVTAAGASLMIRIAIVEDDPPTSQMFATWLREYDDSFDIEQFGSRTLAEAAIAQRTFDLVVLDIRMGSDSNAGVGLIHDLGKRQNCPVIVV